MTRLFISADLSPDLAVQFPAGLDPAPHFTVLYIAEVAPELVAPALEAITGVIERAAPFDIELSAAGSFEHPNETVAWVGLAEGDGLHALRALRRDLLAALCAAGVGAKQIHPGYTPHATIATLPKGEAWTGELPAGGQTVTELRVTVDKRTTVVPIGAPATTGTTIQAWSERGPANLSQAFIGFTVGEIYNRRTGKRSGDITPALLAELLRVFETRREMDPVCLDWDHGSAADNGPGRGGALGRIERMWIEGDKLWMQPALTARGRQVVADHQIGEGDAASSALYASPEIVVNASGLKCRSTGEVYGWAQVLAVAATPRPAQVATAISPIRLSESQSNPRAEHGAPDDTRSEADMNPIEVMARLRANGIDEETIKAVLGDDYVAPGEGGEAGEAAAAGDASAAPAAIPPLAEGAGEAEGAAEDPEKPKSAEDGMFSERLLFAETRAKKAEARSEHVQRQITQLFAERERERKAVIKGRVQADYELAVAEGRCGLGDEQRFAFSELGLAAEAAKLTARTANPKITDEALAKLPEVRTFTAMFSEVRVDHADLRQTYGHGQRPADPAQETIESAVLKFGEEKGIDDFFAAEKAFAEQFPKKHTQLYRKEGLI